MLASVFDNNDDSDDFSHLDSESKEGEDEGVPAYTSQLQFCLKKMAVLSQFVYTEALASYSYKDIIIMKIMEPLELLFPVDLAASLLALPCVPCIVCVIRQLKFQYTT